MGPWSWALFLGLTPPFGVKKIMKVWKNENHVKHPMDRPTNHVVSITCFWKCASQLWKHVHRTHASIFSKWATSFVRCVFCNLRHVRKKQLWASCPVFYYFGEGGPLALLGTKGPIFGAQLFCLCVWCCKAARAHAQGTFFHVLIGGRDLLVLVHMCRVGVMEMVSL